MAIVFLAALFPLPFSRLAMGGVLNGFENIYDTSEALAKARSPVVCILDTEHPERIKEEQQGKKPQEYKCRQLKAKVEMLARIPCVLVHYSQVTRKDFDNPKIKAILISARRKMISKECDEELFALIRETRIPTIGFCGAHELIAQAYGGKIGKMRPLRSDEKDPMPDYWPGIYKEWGFQKVRVLKRDPLFAGLGNEIVVRQFHAWEITELPPDFEVLASSQECKIQAIKHKEKLLYGLQFHAELYDDAHPAGKIILKNFLRIAGVR